MSEPIPGWDRTSRDEKVRLLARGDLGLEEACPTCGRRVAVVRGYRVQHTDPATWGSRNIEQCRSELTWQGT